VRGLHDQRQCAGQPTGPATGADQQLARPLLELREFVEQLRARVRGQFLVRQLDHAGHDHAGYDHAGYDHARHDHPGSERHEWGCDPRHGDDQQQHEHRDGDGDWDRDRHRDRDGYRLRRRRGRAHGLDLIDARRRGDGGGPRWSYGVEIRVAV